MLAFQITAFALLVLAIACIYGPQLVFFGPRVLPVMMKQPETRFVGGFMASAMAFIVVAPQFGTILSQGGEAVTMVVLDIFSMSFGVV